MKWLFYSVLTCLLISCNSKKTFELTSEINAVKKEYAPDKRVAIFNITAVTTSDGSLLLKGETNLPKALKSLKSRFSSQKKLIDSVQILPAKDLKGFYFGVVNISVCNIRSKPAHSAELATQALQGMPLKILKKQEDWYYVQTPDNYLGWLDMGGLTLMDATGFGAWEQRDKVMFIKDYGNVYELNTHVIISDAVIGNTFAVLSKTKEKFTVIFPDGRKGWIPATDALLYSDWLLNSRNDATHILASARSFMGRPYLWGGTSPKAMDCSGFTKMVYFLNGIALSRDASQQVKDGEAIAFDATLQQLQKGDLLFFGTKETATKKERIWHVAIYIGDGEIIHASGAIKIESLIPGRKNFAKKRLNTFIKARRIIGTVHTVK
ncbi:MAG: C40 family peptidase [Flavobacteriaceae bacterium]|nr:C40 family peptidase [Flavobacteriaceae bacterium]